MLVRFAFVTLLVVFAFAPLSADEPITVKVASGRKFTGQVDARTDEESLWLRSERGSAWLLRPIAWPRVVSAELGGLTLSPDDLKARATPEPIRTKPALTQAVPPTPIAAPVPLVTPPAIAKSLALDAQLASWDSDAAPDGLLVTLDPRDARGKAAVVTGKLVVECWGLERRHGKPGGELTLVERWTRSVTLADYDHRGVVLQLSFGSIDPSTQPNFHPSGIVRARFSIPGSGELEASLDGIRLRSYTPVQDWQQQGDTWLK